MKKYIFIGAVLVGIIATTFLYVSRATIAPQTVSVTATTSETVISAMRSFSTEGVLMFTGHEYPGMGFFIDSINGRENAAGRYWFLYVNGVSATTGASTMTVHKGDLVEWRYEKSY